MATPQPAVRLRPEATSAPSTPGGRRPARRPSRTRAVSRRPGRDRRRAIGTRAELPPRRRSRRSPCAAGVPPPESVPLAVHRRWRAVGGRRPWRSAAVAVRLAAAAAGRRSTAALAASRAGHRPAAPPTLPWPTGGQAAVAVPRLGVTVAVRARDAGADRQPDQDHDRLPRSCSDHPLAAGAQRARRHHDASRRGRS